jgi:hypothetical protein
MTLSQNKCFSLLVLIVSCVLLSSCSIVFAADAMPAFSEEDFAGCTITGMKLYYAVHAETTTSTEIAGEFWDEKGEPQTPNTSFIDFSLYYYLNAEEARGYYKQSADQLRESCKILANNGVDTLLQCDVFDDETTVLTSQVLPRGTYYFGSYYRIYDEHYFYFFSFELHPPATEQQAWETLAQMKDCIMQVINKKDRKFWGKVTDAWQHELPGMVVKLSYDGKEYETTTDENGTYRIAFDGAFGKQARLSFVMQLYDEEIDKVFFTININDNLPDMPYQFDENFTVRNENDLKHDFVVKGANVGIGNGAGSGYEFMGYIFYRVTQAIAVYAREFGDEFQEKIQEVNIKPFVQAIRNNQVLYKSTFYNEDLKAIILLDSHTIYTDYVSLFRSVEVEFHEYSHHVMNCYYGKLPPPPADSIIPELNHKGYINPSTADSFVEGFALFMAQVVKDKLGFASAGNDTLFGSLEVNTRAWDGYGESEDMAVAGIFWDLYDGVDAADNDDVQLTLQEIWGVLKANKANMYEVYQKFANDFPDKKAGIDRIFVSHGFFADTDKGNGKYDPNEPMRGSISNNDYYFVDLANPPVWDKKKKDGQELDEMETIGQATNYERPSRYFPLPKPLQMIKTNDPFPEYKVTISFADNPSLNHELYVEKIDGMVPISMPPETYKATITVEGYGEGVTTAAPLTFTNQEYFAGVAKTVEQGYYAEHDFKITGTAPTRPVTDPALTGRGNGSTSPCAATKLLGKNSPQLDTLRRFRDEVLEKSALGKQLVQIYYANSGTIIASLEGHELCRAAATALLKKIIPVIEMTLT